jgi:hypothetical protein
VNPIDFSQIPLRDIHLPGPVGWWPPAPGWWILLGALVVAAAIAFVRYRRLHRERAALKALNAVLAALEQGEEPAYCLQRISMILRRFAMSVAAKSDAVAGLTGERWLAYLDSRWDRAAFAGGTGRALTVGPYARPERVRADDVVELNAVCREWVSAQRRHKET